MRLINAKVFINGKFENVEVVIKDGKILQIDQPYEMDNEWADEEVFDCEGGYLTPGLVDIHTHAAVCEDFSVSDEEGISKMLDYYANRGVTDVLATTMTEKVETLCDAATRLGDHIKAETAGKTKETIAHLHGIYMEGPFFGAAKKGAHDEKLLMAPDEEFFEKFRSNSDNKVKIVAVDPLQEHAMDFIEKYSKDTVISLAHTACDYEMAKKGFELGADHVTHTFNAMNPFGHRDPGLIGAALENKKVFCELICDGIHIHPSVIRVMFSTIPERLVLISDSMQAAGMEDGVYTLGGKTVYCKAGKATLADGTIAGSVIALSDAVKRVVAFGVEPEKAVRAATENPARSARIDKVAGYIKKGRKADLVLFDREFNVQHVFLGGKCIR